MDGIIFFQVQRIYINIVVWYRDLPSCLDSGKLNENEYTYHQESNAEDLP